MEPTIKTRIVQVIETILETEDARTITYTSVNGEMVLGRFVENKLALVGKK